MRALAIIIGIIALCVIIGFILLFSASSPDNAPSEPVVIELPDTYER